MGSVRGDSEQRARANSRLVQPTRLELSLLDPQVARVTRLHAGGHESLSLISECDHVTWPPATRLRRHDHREGVGVPSSHLFYYVCARVRAGMSSEPRGAAATAHPGPATTNALTGVGRGRRCGFSYVACARVRARRVAGTPDDALHETSRPRASG
jgi:hypothetical protein